MHTPYTRMLIGYSVCNIYIYIYIYIYIDYIYRMSENYEFMKTSEAQDVTEYSPYVDKQYNNYINDINNGVYTNNSLYLSQF
jgi:hypothetical protein